MQALILNDLYFLFSILKFLLFMKFSLLHLNIFISFFLANQTKFKFRNCGIKNFSANI